MSENNENKPKKKRFWNGRILPKNNQVRICGIIADEFKEDFKTSYGIHYKSIIKVRRLSGVEDFVPVVVPKSLMGDVSKSSLKGKYVQFEGSFCSYSVVGEDGRRHLILYLFPNAMDIYDTQKEVEWKNDRNEIYLDGYICKQPTIKTTTMSKKMIVETMIEIKRFPNKMDYIPIVFWGSEAICVSEMQKGDNIKLEGRIQSRIYFKKYSPETEEGEYKTTYEVSVKQIFDP